MTSARETLDRLRSFVADNTPPGNPIAELVTWKIDREIGRMDAGFVTPQSIMKVVADHFLLTVDDLTGESRHHHVTRPRRIAAHLVRKIMGYSLLTTGRAINRHHTTIIYGEQSLAAEMARDPATRELVAILERRARG